ncbi:MAG: helicase [Gammaproteobacteria bacterium]|nr:helicase [Gammaproteobacteria bacterium]
MLWQLYGDEVEEEAREDDNLPLTSFQKHGVARALRLIRDTGGAIVADEVGLGKSFIAGEIVQMYRERRQRALLICPAAVRDAVWRKFLARFQLYVECLSFEQLAADHQLRDRQRPNANSEHLQRDLDEYQLVVVDEAHNYRNPDAPTRAAALRRLLYGRRRDVLLLTATPVNNSLWDLYHLVRFFVRQDASFADRGILSIRERFHNAMREDPSNLSPDVLFPVIDATTVKRTRQFVKKHYAGDTISGPDGNPVPIVFPKPSAITVRYDLDHLRPGFFDRLEGALDPDSTNGLTFARYRPAAFLLCPEDDETAHADAAAGLLRSGLLKRFESSARAFGKTTDKMAREHAHFLNALAEGHVVTTAFLRELSADDDAVFEDVLAGTSHRADADLYDTDRLRAAVKRDLELLRSLSAEALAITPDTDPKLRVLSDALVAIARQAHREAAHEADERDKRKVLVFSFFQDTVEWIRDFLKDEVSRRDALDPYRDRHVAISGSDEFSDISRNRAVHGFAPVSTEAPAGRQDNAYDLLVATDVLAEGVNLQQCRHIINFDLPWNPMRLVQRHGRIDRIGSPHTEVFLRTVFPADRLDNLLDLENRILDKLALAAASVGVMAPVEGAAHGPQVFTETRDEIEQLLREDASLYERGGTASSTQTGEEYRQTLRKALAEDRRRILALPRKVGSGMAVGDRRGVFFCASVGDRTYLRFVPADEAWNVAAEVVMRETGTCLRLIECEQETPVWFPEFLQDRVYDFWEAARHDIRDDWMVQTDPANLQPRVRPLNLRVAEFIRNHAPPEIAQERLHRVLDVLESPWPRREEVMLRGWFDETDRNPASARALIDKILETGLEPVAPPDPLPPIELDDIDLICWMAIDPVESLASPA